MLNASQNTPMDLQRIVAYDYLMVHSGDIESGPCSLHPSVPHRGTELLVKRGAIHAGLNIMLAKELIQIDFVPQGFQYRNTNLTDSFIQLLKSTYAAELEKRADWVAHHFSVYSDAELDAYVTQNIGRWGAEFDMLNAIDTLEL